MRNRLRFAHFSKWLFGRARRKLRSVGRIRRSYALPVEGLVFIGVTMLIGLAAVNTGAQLLYLVFGMMCAFWVLSDLLATSSMRGIELKREAPRLVIARQPVRVSIRVRNLKSFFSTFSLRLYDRLLGGRVIGAAFLAKLKPGEVQTLQYRCVFPRRGLYRFEGIQIVTRFPFGLIRRTMAMSEPDEILVLPAAIPVENILQNARVDLGDYDTQTKGRGTSLYGIREYRPGESSRDIHWKLSARTGTLMLREYESEERRRATVVLDNRLSLKATFEEQERLEKAIVLANSVIAYLIDRGHQVELLTATGKVAFGLGPRHLLRCRRALASLAIEPAGAHPPELHGIEEGTVIFSILLRDSEAPPANAVTLRVGDHDAQLSDAISDLDKRETQKLPGIDQLY